MHDCSHDFVTMMGVSMSAELGRWINSRQSGSRAMLLGLCLLCAFGSSTVKASPVQSQHQHRWTWDDALATHMPLAMNAAAKWEHELAIQIAGANFFGPMQFRVPRGFHLLTVNGLLPDTPFIAYLHWRRSLNPARFD